MIPWFLTFVLLSSLLITVSALFDPTSFANANNTGYRNAPGYPGSLTTTWDYANSLANNSVYNYVDFPDGATIGVRDAPAFNVTFNGCRFHGVAVNAALVIVYGDELIFNYCSFEPGVTAPPTPFDQSYEYGIVADGGYYSFVHHLIVNHCDFWGFGGAITIEGSTQSKPHEIRWTWIHDAADDGGQYHTDGIGSTSGSGTGSYVVMDHCTVESLGNTNGIAFQAGTYDHYTFTNNLFGGFGYTIALFGGSNSHVFVNNTYSTRLHTEFGPLYPQEFWTGSSLWQNNRWHVPATGAAWGHVENDGKYWLPNIISDGTSDNEVTSTVDYQSSVSTTTPLSTAATTPSSTSSTNTSAANTPTASSSTSPSSSTTIHATSTSPSTTQSSSSPHYASTTTILSFASIIVFLANLL